MVEKLIRSKEEWQRMLPPDHFHLLFENGTEAPYHNKYDEFWETGTYVCFACGLPVFSSAAKFNSGTGWPSFWEPISPDAVEEHEGPLVLHDPDGGGLRALRRTLGPRLQRRPAAHGPALLHELRSARLQA